MVKNPVPSSRRITEQQCCGMQREEHLKRLMSGQILTLNRGPGWTQIIRLGNCTSTSFLSKQQVLLLCYTVAIPLGTWSFSPPHCGTVNNNKGDFCSSIFWIWMWTSYLCITLFHIGAQVCIQPESSRTNFRRKVSTDLHETLTWTGHRGNKIKL